MIRDFPQRECDRPLDWGLFLSTVHHVRFNIVHTIIGGALIVPIISRCSKKIMSHTFVLLYNMYVHTYTSSYRFGGMYILFF